MKATTQSATVADRLLSFSQVAEGMKLGKNSNTTLRKQVRQKEEREPTSGAAIIDSQSAKTTRVKGEGGFDAGKKSF
jgi:hypothetical protein